jgi:hypothetical protein
MPYVKRFRTAWKTALAVEIFVIVFCAGCGSRTLLVPPGEPVRLREPILGAKVWVADKDGKEVPAVVDLPAGWYALPDPGEK